MDYHMYYVLSLFNSQRAISSSQLLHTFQGKRTPSMFYLAEKNGWHHAFARFTKVSNQEIEKVLEGLFHKGLITQKDKGFILTEKGQLISKEFFENRYYPQASSFAAGNIWKAFWDRYQLFVQTFSEMSYKNNRYVPIIKYPPHQENVRLLFQQFHHDKEMLMRNWIKEQHFLFEQLDERRANVLMEQLTGHERVGETKRQIQRQLDMEVLEYSFYHQDTIEELLNIIQQHPEKLAISYAILNQLQVETNHGLSSSTNASFELLSQGHSISDIATIRRLKENTVREHILELAFVLYDFPIKTFVPKKVYEDLNLAFEKNEDYSYKEAKSEFKDLEFMYYRLVELERMRKNGGSVEFNIT